jgi:hypothetical protein
MPAMRGWIVLVGTFLVGVVVGVGLANRGPALIAPYLPKAVSGPGEHIEGQVVRKQRDGNRLLVKISTAQGPMLVTFTQKVADLDVLLDAGDTVTLVIPAYATFVDDPILERVKEPAGAQASPPPSSPGAPHAPTR